MKNDIYQSVTDKIIQQLEKGVRPWCAPWNTSHMQGRVTLPLRHNGLIAASISSRSGWPPSKRAAAPPSG